MQVDHLKTRGLEGAIVAIQGQRNRTRQKQQSQDLLCKSPRQCLFARDLLRSDEAFNGHSNGTIDVLCRAMLRQSHLAESFADADDGLEMTDLNICGSVLHSPIWGIVLE